MGDLSNKQVKRVKKELATALQNLEQLSLSLERAPSPNLYAITIRQGTLFTQRSSFFWSHLKLTGQLIAQTLFSRPPLTKERKGTEQEILKWVDTVKTHLPQIHQLREGSREERSTANSLLQAVRRYNLLLRRSSRPPNTLRGKLHAFLYKKTGYEFGEKLLASSIHIKPSKKERTLRASGKTSAQSLQLTSRKKRTKTQPTQQEMDAFHLKAARLLQKYSKHPLPSLHFNSVKSLPTHSTLSLSHKKLETIVVLSKKIPSLPGERLKLTGAFRRDPQSKLSTPLPESFQLLTQSQQTGFPHPLQYCGWIVPSACLPEDLLRPSESPQLSALFKRRQQVARGLMPGGSWVHHGRVCHEKRLRTLGRHKKELLAFHEALTHALFHSLGGTPSSLLSFFSLLRSESQPLELLASTYQKISLHYGQKLATDLQSYWIALPQTAPSPQHRETCQRVLATSSQNIRKRQKKRLKQIACAREQIKERFIQCLGEALLPHLEECLLQIHSELMGFAPPFLSHPSQLLQSLAIKQLTFFCQMIENPDWQHLTPEAEWKEVEKLMKEDLHLITSFSSCPLVEALESYYSHRFLSS